MSLLPEQLTTLDATGRPLPPERWFKKVEPRAEGLARVEDDWDEIICANEEALADALRAAGMIAWDSTLRVVGRQLWNIDVMFVEVPIPPAGAPSDALGEPRRLILLEDKLIRNPEAKRQVLAQVVDYARWIQDEEMMAEHLASLPGLAVSPKWLRDRASSINVMLATGDMLLVIAGDDIDDDLLSLARRFASGGLSPVSRNELCLVSLAMYRRGEELLLVPHVVSAVERPRRELSVRVTVRTKDGAALPATVSAEMVPSDVPAKRSSLPVVPEVKAFLRQAKERRRPARC